MRIAILSRSDSSHADLIEACCATVGDVVRLDFDFDAADSFRPIALGLSETIPQGNFDAVFVHHPRVSVRDDWFVDEIEKRLFVASWDSVPEWMEARFPAARWMNKPTLCHQSRNVLRQLRIATELGFEVPATLFTNQLDDLRRFADGSVVAVKQGNLGVHLPEQTIFTSLVDIDSIDRNELRHCPCLFQLYIDKKYELRVHVIEHEVFVCRIDSQASEKTRVDWRNYDLDNTPHSQIEIDSGLRTRCCAIVRELGLSFGILDLIVTPDDRTVFLECNAQGHWAWIEEMIGLPITTAICRHLLGA